MIFPFNLLFCSGLDEIAGKHCKYTKITDDKEQPQNALSSRYPGPRYSSSTDIYARESKPLIKHIGTREQEKGILKIHVIFVRNISRIWQYLSQLESRLSTTKSWNELTDKNMLYIEEELPDESSSQLKIGRILVVLGGEHSSNTRVDLCAFK